MRDGVRGLWKNTETCPLNFPDLLQRAATMPPFDILKKIDAVNFDRVEVVRDFQTAEACALKAIAI